MTEHDSGMLGSVRVLPRRRVRLGDLKPHAKNPRVALEPGDPDFENIRASLKQIGLADEIVWNEATGRIVGGHQRVAVLRAEGAREDDEIDVKVVSIPDEREEVAAAILLIKAEGRWDYAKLLGRGPECATEPLPPEIAARLGFPGLGALRRRAFLTV